MSEPAPAPTPKHPDEGDVEVRVRFPRRWVAAVLALAIAGSGGGTAVAMRAMQPPAPSLECPNTAQVHMHERQLGDHETRTRQLEQDRTATVTRLEGILTAIGQLDGKVERLGRRR